MILLLRHGQTFWNREGRIQGHTESDLTPLGVQQAEAMAGLVADLVRRDASPWRLVSSPIGRARRTAEAVARATGLQDTLDQDVPQDAIHRLQNGQIERLDCEPLV